MISDMNTVLRATDPAEFLGLVPSLAGFTPRQSIVLVPFRGSRAYGAIRIDLPRDEVDLDDYVDGAIGLVSHVDATDAVAVVVYVDQPPQTTRDGLVLPFTVVVEDILDLAVDLGMRIVDALCVMPTGWSSYLHDEPALRALSEIPPPAPVPGLTDVSGDQDAGAALPVVDLAEKERVGRALLDLSAVLSGELSPRDRVNPQALDAVALLDDLTLLFEAVLESPVNPPPYVTAALLWCLERPRFRDVALLQWATDMPNGVRALAAQLSYADAGTPIPDDLGLILLGQGAAPDADRLMLALTVVRGIAARAPREYRLAPLTIAAWLSWALGRSTHAAHHLAAVAEIDPGYSMAALIGTMIDAAVLPEWTFRRGENRGGRPELT